MYVIKAQQGGTYRSCFARRNPNAPTGAGDRIGCYRPLGVLRIKSVARAVTYKYKKEIPVQSRLRWTREFEYFRRGLATPDWASNPPSRHPPLACTEGGQSKDKSSTSVTRKFVPPALDAGPPTPRLLPLLKKFQSVSERPKWSPARKCNQYLVPCPGKLHLDIPSAMLLVN